MARTSAASQWPPGSLARRLEMRTALVAHRVRAAWERARDTRAAAAAQCVETRKFPHAWHAADLGGLTAAQEVQLAGCIGRASTAVHEW